MQSESEMLKKLKKTNLDLLKLRIFQRNRNGYLRNAIENEDLNNLGIALSSSNNVDEFLELAEVL